MTYGLRTFWSLCINIIPVCDSEEKKMLVMISSPIPAKANLSTPKHTSTNNASAISAK